MAGKNNAKPAKQAEPATDAAMAEATDGAVEQDVAMLSPSVRLEDSLTAAATPPVPEGGALPIAGNDGGQDDGPEEFDTSMWFPSPDRQGGNFDPAEVREFFHGLFQGFALMLIKADVLVRKNGEEVSPLPEDLLAVTLRQNEIAFVTCDGRKFRLKGGKINEAQ